MLRPVRHRSFAPVRASVLVGALIIGLVPAVQVAADSYDDACATPTLVDVGGSQTYNLAAGQTLLILGTYTGVINSFAGGAVICVATTATFQPTALNNAAGSILVRGTATLPSTSLDTGFSLDNFGDASFPSGVNVNGAATVTNRLHAVMSFGTSLNWGGNGTLVNDGAMSVNGGLNQNNGTIQNTGDFTISGDVNINGSVSNSGTLAMGGGEVNVNSSGDLDNQCTLTASGNLTNNGSEGVNNGIVLIAGHYQNNGGGGLATGLGSVLSSSTLGNDGSITGSGALRIEGNSVHQGTLVGDPVNLINVFDVTQSNPPQLFDTQSGAVSNAFRAAIPVPDPDTVSSGCATQPPASPSADLLVEKTGDPGSVFIGELVTYEIVVTNQGPDTATAVVLTEEFEDGFVPVPGSGHLVSRFALFTLGDIAADDSVTVQVTGVYTLTGVFSDSALASAAEEDPDPTNNSGENPEAIVDTVVVNRPPVLDGTSLITATNSWVTGQVTGSDPDPGQSLGYTAGLPVAGSVVVDVSGGLTYTPDPGYAGRDQFTVQVCDDGVPTECATALVDVEVFPVAVDDEAGTTAGESVTVEVEINDLGLVTPPIVVIPPGSGTAVPGGSITYTPDPGFTGSDSFVYEVCAQSAADLCDQATVSVGVMAIPTTTTTSAPIDPTSTVSASSTVDDVSGSGTTNASGLPLTGVEVFGLVISALAMVLLGVVAVRSGREVG